MKRRCADAGLLQTSLGTVCEFHSPDPAVVERNVADCREWVELARDIGARGVKVRPNGLPKDPGSGVLLGISVVTEDRELGQAVLDLLGNSMAHYTLGDIYTFVVERM